jgi:hypothetical protein
LIADDITAIGCAPEGKVPMKVRKFSCTKVCRLIRSTNASSWSAVGSSPLTSR